MDLIYRERVLALMRDEVAKLPCGDAGGGATIEYTLDSTSFFSDVELAVGYEYCFAHVYEHKTLANGMILTILYGTAEVHIPEVGLEFADSFITKVEC